ncbi:erythromycin esterase family protein [Fulvivirga lutea]|uniref:Erythromycin esterase family protein n=1 Tax=Fulvivirga lutea TaxID=2810512 RepID=A0A974WG20_9BACT|nr:erythromycin esterase family protein [Fulvivirga lutea]QSE97380.1 erythromycin esterase family protein [Fulvivirga lutea]
MDRFFLSQTPWVSCSIILLSLFISSCKDDEEIILDTQTKALVETLDQELKPLTINPLDWSDEELSFLDPLANKKIIALGESTHGTAEFFDSKHRIFKYFVENHDFKVFAFEADFGESLLINDAVQRGASNEIEELMKSKMHFWTWRTEEVKNLLVWMSNYNQSKSEEDKLQYVGVDCQFNTFHPGMVRSYLNKTDATFFASADEILIEAKSASEGYFAAYSLEQFETYLEKIDELKALMTNYKEELIEVSSEREFKLHVRILEVIKQVSIVRYYRGDYTINYRDKYMAENTVWFNDYFDGNKIVLWAHNRHIADEPNYGGGGSMGHRLKQDLTTDYTTIGFLFSRGSFTAVTQRGDQFRELQTQTINANPKTNSINFVMSQGKQSVFALKTIDLQKYGEWNDAFANSIEIFEIGAAFNNNPSDYYFKFDPAFYEYIIYFDTTTASVLL